MRLLTRIRRMQKKYVPLSTKKLLFSYSLVIILLINNLTTAYSQETAKVVTAHQKFFIGINGGPTVSQEINSTVTSISGLTSVDKNTFSGSFELGYFFSRSFGLSTGIEYCTFSSELSLNSYENKFNTTDSENETYERRVTGSDIKEIQNITFLKVPLCLNLQLFFGKRFGIYILAGANLVLPLNKEYAGSGTFSYVGYYPAYNVTFQNLPAYGFPANATVNTKGQLELKSTNFEGLAGAGFQCFVSKKIQITLGATYSRSLSTISGFTAQDKFQLSSDINSINSMMGGSSNVTAQSMGLRLGIRYYLK
jgi:OmpA-OmpF porin, OOP family